MGLVLPRKNGKTLLLAAYALFRLLTDQDMPEILLAASSDKQAGRLFEAILSFVRRNPALAEMLVLREYIGEIARADGGGKILRMASDPGKLHGYNPSLIIGDELHTWTTPSLRRGWAALTTGGGAREDPQTFGISTAGEAAERATSILGRMIDANEKAGLESGDPIRYEIPFPALTISRDFDARLLIYNHSACLVEQQESGPPIRRPLKDPTNVAAMKEANPASWITPAYLSKQAKNPELTAAQVLQLHGCVWAEGEGTFIAPDVWTALYRGDEARIRPGAVVCLGFDGSRSYDTTVAAWASRMPNGQIAVKTHVWSTRHDVPHHTHVPGGRIDFGAFESYTLGLFDEYQVRDAAYDPRYLVRSVELIRERLTDAQIAEVEPQSANMRQAIAVFYQVVADGTLIHDGDPVLAAHIAAAKGVKDERGWVLSKRNQAKPIDALIASVYAVWRVTIEPVVDEAPWAMTWR